MTATRGRAVLLTWNPGPGDDRRWTPGRWDQTMVAPHTRGEVVVTSWGIGRHVNGYQPGQLALLYRQGAHGRGLVARGELIRGPWPDPAAARNLVDVEWQESVPIRDALEVAELERTVPMFAWRQVWSSGRHLAEDATAGVMRAWADHVDDVGRACGSREVGSAP